MRNSRLVFKTMCRCFQIWPSGGKWMEEAAWRPDEILHFFFHRPSCAKCGTFGRSQFQMNSMTHCARVANANSQTTTAATVSHLLLPEFKDLLMSLISLCFSPSPQKKNPKKTGSFSIFCSLPNALPPLSLRLSPREQNKSMDFRMTVDVKTGPQGILTRSKT